MVPWYEGELGSTPPQQINEQSKNVLQELKLNHQLASEALEFVIIQQRHSTRNSSPSEDDCANHELRPTLQGLKRGGNECWLTILKLQLLLGLS